MHITQAVKRYHDSLEIWLTVRETLPAHGDLHLVEDARAQADAALEDLVHGEQEALPIWREAGEIEYVTPAGFETARKSQEL